MAERKCVLALGFFDGVHRGHAALLNRTIERAEALGVEGAVMTFDTHPDTLVQGTPVPLINSAPDRANLIRRLFGIDRVEFFRFTAERHAENLVYMTSELRKQFGSRYTIGVYFGYGMEHSSNLRRMRMESPERYVLTVPDGTAALFRGKSLPPGTHELLP